METFLFGDLCISDDPGGDLCRAVLQDGKPLTDEHLLCLSENAPDIVYVLGEDGTLCYANPAWQRILGHRPGEVLGRSLGEFVSPSLRSDFEALFERVLRHGVTLGSVSASLLTDDGANRHFSISAFPCRSAAGAISGVVGILRDVTTRTDIQESLRRSESRFRAVMEASLDPMVVQDLDGNITDVNPAFARVFGWSPEESVGRRIDFVPADKRDESCRMLDSARGGASFGVIDSRRLTKDGRRLNVSISGAVFSDGEGRPEGYISTLRDITQSKQNEAELAFFAYHDPLTGLPNRKSFYTKLEEMLASSGRRRGDRQWAVLFMDLNRFKQINESLGHDIGDELLRAVATRVKGTIRSSDFFSRLGGDEFSIILTDLREDLDVARVARKVMAEVERPYNVGGEHIETDVSIGISLFPGDASEAESLMKNAEMAMYAAKQGGTGYQFFTEEMNRRARHRMQMESGLRQALQRREMLLYYQPLVDRHQRIVGVEALLRWQHPEMGLLAPDEFILIAEETGAIIPIGEWVLKTACRQVKQWQEETGEDLSVAVNLSARQFRDPNLADMVLETLSETGLRPRFLKLEVTESSVMEEPEAAIKVMETLKRHQIAFSIDDFGTGYSSFSYLKRFPIDALKIDRCFVKDSLTSRGDREIIRSIITMARNLRLEIIAEGVETAEQRQFLQELDCGGMQGYFFGRPLPVQEWEAFFMARRCESQAG